MNYLGDTIDGNVQEPFDLVLLAVSQAQTPIFHRYVDIYIYLYIYVMHALELHINTNLPLFHSARQARQQ